mmetsp:Transcript_146504/g.255561  ORF Transcript_146504/g.255561 Transcript_146504/m.255561 type:complete len:442 (-) Transcript_146504:66-1391(-)
MGSGVRPQGSNTFAHFLNAQETSPTLTLTYAGVSDEGMLEIAHFLARNRHLVRLDLTGNDLSSTGVFHLCKAMKQNQTMESLVMKHNRLGQEGAMGLETLCKSLYGNRILRHLDLRHCGLSGVTAATMIGQLLKNNTIITHLELSWNPIDLDGGQVLLEAMRYNTTLFDCQLTGCRIADETLLGMAQLLHRNRKAKGADMQAGPYRALIDPADTRGNALLGDGVEVPYSAPDRLPHPSSSMVVSATATYEFMSRLLKYQGAKNVSSKDSTLALELYHHLDKGHKELEMDREIVENMHKHMKAVGEGFRDRELRYRRNIAAAQRKLMEEKREVQELRGIMSRRSEELGLGRDLHAQMLKDRDSDQRNFEYEEGVLKHTLSGILSDQKELTQRLADLKERLRLAEKENAEMRSRTVRLRDGVTMLDPPPTWALQRPVFPQQEG